MAGHSASWDTPRSTSSSSTSTSTSTTRTTPEAPRGAAPEGDVAMSPGQLRVYLGAAPGVGKTYKMLEEGHRRRDRGTDVVVGLCECHGRKHTEELVEGLEVVPRRTFFFRGTAFTEM